MIQECDGSLRISATARRCDKDFFAASQSLRTFFGIVERLARHCYPVNPGFELAWHAKIIHRQANDRDISREKLRQCLASLFDVESRNWCRSLGSGQMSAGKMLQGIGCKV